MSSNFKHEANTLKAKVDLKWLCNWCQSVFKRRPSLGLWPDFPFEDKNVFTRIYRFNTKQCESTLQSNTPTYPKDRRFVWTFPDLCDSLADKEYVKMRKSMEHWWNHIDRGKSKYLGKNSPITTLFTKNLAWTDTGHGTRNFKKQTKIHWKSGRIHTLWGLERQKHFVRFFPCFRCLSRSSFW